jgi:hypothetical protein
VKTLLLVNLAATLMMVGVIWIIQIVHYPLFNRIGAEAFRQYEADHTVLITYIVLPLMLAELVTAFLLATSPPPGITPVIMWGAFGLVVIAWASTALIQVPQHSRLASGFDEATYRLLVNSNWVRTVAWSLRGIIMIWVMSVLLGDQV